MNNIDKIWAANAEIERLQAELRLQGAAYKQAEEDLAHVASSKRAFALALLNADAVAHERGERFGLCDCVDNKGNPYPSQWLADLLTRARESELEAEPVKPIAPRWSTAAQWEPGK